MPPFPAPLEHPSLASAPSDAPTLRSTHPQARRLTPVLGDLPPLDCLYLLRALADLDRKELGPGCAEVQRHDAPAQLALHLVRVCATETKLKPTHRVYERWQQSLASGPAATEDGAEADLLADEVPTVQAVERVLGTGSWTRIRQLALGEVPIPKPDPRRRDKRRTGPSYSPEELVFIHRLRALEEGTLHPTKRGYQHTAQPWAAGRVADHGEWIDAGDMERALRVLAQRLGLNGTTAHRVPDPGSLDPADRLALEELHRVGQAWLAEPRPFERVRVPLSWSPFERAFGGVGLLQRESGLPGSGTPHVKLDDDELLQVTREMAALSRSRLGRPLSEPRWQRLRAQLNQEMDETGVALAELGLSVSLPPQAHALRVRFGSFGDALERAGVRRQREWEREKQHGMPRLPDEAGLEDVRRWAAEPGRMRVGDYRLWRERELNRATDGRPPVSSAWLYERFGKWPQVLRAAGLA